MNSILLFVVLFAVAFAQTQVKFVNSLTQAVTVSGGGFSAALNSFEVTQYVNSPQTFAVTISNSTTTLTGPLNVVVNGPTVVAVYKSNATATPNIVSFSEVLIPAQTDNNGGDFVFIRFINLIQTNADFLEGANTLFAGVGPNSQSSYTQVSSPDGVTFSIRTVAGTSAAVGLPVNFVQGGSYTAYGFVNAAGTPVLQFEFDRLTNGSLGSSTTLASSTSGATSTGASSTTSRATSTGASSTTSRATTTGVAGSTTNGATTTSRATTTGVAGSTTNGATSTTSRATTTSSTTVGTTTSSSNSTNGVSTTNGQSSTTSNDESSSVTMIASVFLIVAALLF